MVARLMERSINLVFLPINVAMKLKQPLNMRHFNDEITRMIR